MSEAASRPRLYLDTNVFIEMFEKRGAVSDRLLDLFRGPTLPRHHLVTSQLTIAEILVDAIRDDDMQRNDLYLGFLRDIPNLMTVAPISRDVLIRAALIRARQPRIKLPDAIHLSTARDEECRILISNDARMRSVPHFDEIVPLTREALDRLLERLA
jgi:predicted nucleic acid-binding protein